MPTRRRYKTPQGFKDGGAVPPSNITDAQQPETIATAPPVEPPIKKLKDYPDLPPSHPHDLDAVRRAAEAVRRAEEYQKNPQALIDQYVDSMPNLSEHSAAF